MSDTAEISGGNQSVDGTNSSAAVDGQAPSQLLSEQAGQTSVGDTSAHVNPDCNRIAVLDGHESDGPASPRMNSAQFVGNEPALIPTSELTTTATTDISVVRLIGEAEHSAGKLVNLLVKHFSSFRDEARFDGRKVRFYKRAQIFVADLWAAFNGSSYGTFDDIDHLTMFAGVLRAIYSEIIIADDHEDYRVPQMLESLGVLVYSPPLDHAIRIHKDISPGHSWEVQLRGCSIWYQQSSYQRPSVSGRITRRC